MPVSPELAETLAKELLDTYTQAETEMLRTVARRLERGITDPGWAESKLAQTTALRRELEQVVNQLEDATPQQVERAISRAYARGAATAGTDLEATGRIAGAFTGTGDGVAIQVLAREAHGVLSQVGIQALRSTEDVYRSVVFEASRQVSTGVTTRLGAAQRALNRFADRGITGFVDSAGRNWSMASYTEMAVRTTTGRAAVAGHADKLSAEGLDLVQVSDAPEECPICRPWEGRILSLRGRTRDYPTLSQAEAAGLFHPNCFPAETQVSSPSGIRAADSRWYEGDLVVIETASGNELTVTPNHPILTPQGWVAAGDIEVSQNVVRYDSQIERVDVMGPDEQSVEASIGQVFHALRKSGLVATVTMPASAEQFHGDGGDSDVHVVLADRLLQYRPLSDTFEEFGQRHLVLSGVRDSALLSPSALDEIGLASLHAPDSVVSGSDLGRSLICRHGRPLSSFGFGAGDLSASLENPARDGSLRDSNLFGNLSLAHPGAVQLDQVVNVGRREFAGHVYNLESGDGWYVAGGIVAHNCRHSIGLYDPRVSKKPKRTADPQGNEERQKQRYLERGVRNWKRREAVALSPAEAQKAKAKVREWQGSLRTFVSENDRKRLSYREQIGTAR